MNHSSRNMSGLVNCTEDIVMEFERDVTDNFTIQKTITGENLAPCFHSAMSEFPLEEVPVKLT